MPDRAPTRLSYGMTPSMLSTLCFLVMTVLIAQLPLAVECGALGRWPAAAAADASWLQSEASPSKCFRFAIRSSRAGVDFG